MDLVATKPERGSLTLRVVLEALGEVVRRDRPEVTLGFADATALVAHLTAQAGAAHLAPPAPMLPRGHTLQAIDAAMAQVSAAKARIEDEVAGLGGELDRVRSELAAVAHERDRYREELVLLLRERGRR